jgi:RNA polymerase subunit RPABC4/transcription elongation factor Spt4
VHTKHEFLPPEPFLRFSQRTCSFHYFRSKSHVWVGFAQFRCRTSPIPKTGVGVKLEFSPPEPFLRFSQRTCPIHYFRSKTHVWGGFAQFRCRTSPIPKTGVRVHTKHEFFPPEPFLRFSQQTYPIHYFRSKTHVWGGFAQFRCRTSPIPKTGVGVHTKHEFLPTEPFLRFSQRTCPIHNFRSKTHVWCGFAQFRCRTSPIPKTGVGVHTKHEFLPTEPFLRFSQRTCPIHNYRSKTHVWRGFAQFRCRMLPIPKTGVGVHTSTSFCHRNHFFVFHNEHAHSTTLGPKVMFGVVLRNFVAARHPFRKLVSGCIQSLSFRHRNHFFVFRNEHANPLL